MKNILIVSNSDMCRSRMAQEIFVLFMIARDTSFVFPTNVRLSFKNEKQTYI